MVASVHRGARNTRPARARWWEHRAHRGVPFSSGATWCLRSL